MKPLGFPAGHCGLQVSFGRDGVAAYVEEGKSSCSVCAFEWSHRVSAWLRQPYNAAKGQTWQAWPTSYSASTTCLDRSLPQLLASTSSGSSRCLVDLIVPVTHVAALGLGVRLAFVQREGCAAGREPGPRTF